MANKTQKLIKKLRKQVVAQLEGEEDKKFPFRIPLRQLKYAGLISGISLALVIAITAITTKTLSSDALGPLGFINGLLFLPFLIELMVVGPGIQIPLLKPSELLRTYYTRRVDEVEERAIGSKSEFHKQLEIVGEHRRRALVIMGRAELRFEKSGALYLKEVIDKMQEIVDQALKTERVLEEFKKKIQAFTAEAQVAISDQIDDSFDDIELLQAANALTAEAQIDESEAWKVMGQTLDLLDQQLSTLHHETTHLFDRRSTMEKIVVLVDPADPLRQLAMIEDLAARFQPPRIETIVR